MYALVYLRLVGVCDCFHKVKVKAVGDKICRLKFFLNHEDTKAQRSTKGKVMYFAPMNRLRRFLGVLLIIIGPVIIYIVSTSAFRQVTTCQDVWEAMPWLLLATFIIPIGMSIAVVGFLSVKGEYDS